MRYNKLVLSWYKTTKAFANPDKFELLVFIVGYRCCSLISF
jgi:hypothetical protein